MYKIMIVEDDITIRDELKSLLNRYGYKVSIVEDFFNAVNSIKESNCDLILLDVNLPVFDGYHICREIRKNLDIPIIIVTSRDSEIDELMSMNLGADDFITKPYNTEILLARISSILKRTYKKNESSEILRYKDLILDLSNGSISYNNNYCELTKNELKILSYLIKNQNSIVSRDILMEILWNSDIFVDDNTLSVNITRLRRKLEDIGIKDAIETRRGLGYIMP
ncbi:MULTISPECIES: response regulator transcription factor [Clostridium]|uniref:Stage 0 sporulation protein A homolog n=1 Tax=Clostridium botulinum (strain Eklund 17B / Type B) TaxID=935198 RepID=B2TR97_CLOBB|nr:MULTISPECIES: response regulator transcription factor [Clostridium]ACD23129.1 DNA-binding response regulator [Clostridium botulinum B str. Eklund 17B (NRP)]MBN1046889.1 DNA-binding response regulator [Clostridium botulinum]MBN1053582.1 DNA-binding response regulator [Clostridium botulinum]MBN1056785.1 DNA-binding response regulator [Clostridium botulinum]MBY6977579.1 response regulator transcription factor [Clostridium botulinum]